MSLAYPLIIFWTALGASSAFTVMSATSWAENAVPPLSGTAINDTVATSERTSAGPPPSSPVSPPLASNCDASCVRLNSERAAQACAPQIEAQAPDDFDWIYRPQTGIFQEANTSDGSGSSVVRYRGDSIRFQNSQKEWIRVNYECSWDSASGRIVSLTVKVGRLGKPKTSPVATVPLAGPPKKISERPPEATATSSAAATTGQAAVKSTFVKPKIDEPSETQVRQVVPKPGSTR